MGRGAKSMIPMKMWVMTLVEYDEWGNASIVRSFCKPAEDSKIKLKKAFNAPKSTSKQEEEVNLF
jgi:hypothetical protein